MNLTNWLASWIERLQRGATSTCTDKRRGGRAHRVRLTCEELEQRIGPAVVAPVLTLPDPGDKANDWYGYSVALSGANVLVGAPAVNVGAGAVYLYDSTGQLLQTFLDPNGANNNYFGGALASAGADVLVGAPSENNNIGGAYLFDTSGNLLQAFHDPDPGDADFGDAVALSGNDVLIGAAAHNGGTSAAYLFNTLGQLLQTFPVMQQVGTDFGDWVALSGTNVLVGSQGTNGQTGAAYLYNTSGQLLHTFADPVGTAGLWFGCSVALLGNDVAVGSQSGAVYLYDTSGQLLQTFNAPDGASNTGSFASSVALSGTNLLVGAKGDDGSTGAAYLFSTSGQLLETFQDPNGSGGDGYEKSAALSGTQVLVGAVGVLNGFSAAYLYDIPSAVSAAAISVVAGNNQSTTVGTAFDTPLEAQVTDASGNPLAGYAVTFTVTPGTNSAGAAFAGSTTSTVMTNDQGIATAPTLTANQESGTFIVTATTPGVTVPAQFDLTSSPTVTVFVDSTEGLDCPGIMAFDASGNLYVPNQFSNTISKVSPAGVVTTFVNSNQGLGAPSAVAFDASGNLYIANANGENIDKVTPDGVVSNFVVMPNANEGIYPQGLAFDASGNLYVSCFGYSIIKVTPAGVATIFANDTHLLGGPWGEAFDASVSVRRTPCRSGREAVMARTRHHPTKGTAGTSDSSLVGWDGATMEGASSGR